jgi:predicted AlkP superfamily pyrophosphatase or phosphodiesterase
MPKRLLMLSFDAVGDQDVDFLMSLPNFSSLAGKGTLVREVASIFVSNTYPTHTTIQTGVYPKSHGIMDNTWTVPGSKEEKWRFKAKNIRVRSLVSEAIRTGRTICAVLYPVTGGAKIRYHFPEIAGHLPAWKRALKTIRYGQPIYVISQILRYRHLIKQIKEDSPDSLDRFTTAIAARTILTKAPELVMVHLLDTDGTKHIYGPETKESEQSLIRLDDRLGDLLCAVEKSGHASEYSILIFSDHNCRSVSSILHPQDLLKAKGFTEKEAFFHNAGGSCFLKILTPQDSPRHAALTGFVDSFLTVRGVERLLTAEEMAISGAAGEFDFGFAAKDGFAFGEDLSGQHGYPLDREKYFTFYLAVGEDMPAGKVVTGGQLIDICPLAVDLLGLEPWPVDGKNALRNY